MEGLFSCFEPVLESNSFTAHKDKWVCIHRFIGKSKIEGYKLRNRRTGEIIDITPQELKKNYSKYEPINLKLTKDNKIFYTPYKEVTNIHELIRYNELLMNTNLNKILKSLDKKTSDMTNHELETIYNILQITIDVLNTVDEGFDINMMINSYNDLKSLIKNDKAQDLMHHINSISYFVYIRTRHFVNDTGNREYINYKELLDYISDKTDHFSNDELDNVILKYENKLKTKYSLASILAIIQLECIKNKKEFITNFIEHANDILNKDFDYLNKNSKCEDSYLSNWIDRLDENNLIKLGIIYTETLINMGTYLYSAGNREELLTPNFDYSGELAIPLFPYTSTDIEKILNKK